MSRVFRWEKSYECNDGGMHWALRDTVSDKKGMVTSCLLVSLYEDISGDPKDDHIASLVVELLNKHFSVNPAPSAPTWHAPDGTETTKHAPDVEYCKTSATPATPDGCSGSCGQDCAKCPDPADGHPCVTPNETLARVTVSLDGTATPDGAKSCGTIHVSTIDETAGGNTPAPDVCEWVSDDGNTRKSQCGLRYISNMSDVCPRCRKPVKVADKPAERTCGECGRDGNGCTHQEMPKAQTCEHWTPRKGGGD